MKIRIMALLCAAALLLSACGGSTSEEYVRRTTEPAVTTAPVETTAEPTTVPTEPKTFFEEQGFTFWEGLQVYETMNDDHTPDGGLFAQGKIEDSCEVSATISLPGRGSTQYGLTDTEMEITTSKFTLAKFDEACKEYNWGAVNIKNASDSLYGAFQKENPGLTKSDWLEQYQDYTVWKCVFQRKICMDEFVQRIYNAIPGDKEEWSANWSFKAEAVSLMDCNTGHVYRQYSDVYPGVASVFTVETQEADFVFAAVADLCLEWKRTEDMMASDCHVSEYIFVMVPEDYDGLTFMLPLVETRRSAEEYDSDSADPENAWEVTTYFEYMEDKVYMKPYFFSPYVH